MHIIQGCFVLKNHKILGWLKKSGKYIPVCSPGILHVKNVHPQGWCFSIPGFERRVLFSNGADCF